MKKLLTLTFLIVGMAGTVMAQGNKIAVVDAELVIQQSIKGKRFFQDVEKFQKDKSAEIKAKVDAFKAKEQDFQNKINSLSEEKRRSTGLELDRMKTDIQRMQEDANKEGDLMIKQALDQFRRELIPVIRSVATSNGYDMVMNVGPNSNIAYVNESIDITSAVVAAYDATVKD